MKLIGGVRKHIRTAVSAWRKSWDKIPELVLMTDIIKILFYISLPTVIWYFIWSYGYDTVACASDSDFLHKGNIGSENRTLYDFCDHNYANYFGFNITFAFIMFFRLLPFISGICFGILFYKIVNQHSDRNSLWVNVTIIMLIVFLISLAFLSPYYFFVTYDFGACHTGLDPLNKLGNYSFPYDKHEQEIITLTINDLCSRDYPNYVAINVKFTALVVLEFIGLFCGIVLVALVLRCFYILFTAFRAHFIDTWKIYDQDMAKIV